VLSDGVAGELMSVGVYAYIIYTRVRVCSGGCAQVGERMAVAVRGEQVVLYGVGGRAYMCI